jgi:hypothetical protein
MANIKHREINFYHTGENGKFFTKVFAIFSDK